jgi:formylglycine-generating enzyme required for sulfatase activity
MRRLSLVLSLFMLLLSPPASAQTRSDEEANRLLVEAVKARDEASGARPADDDVPGWTRQHDLLVRVERNLREIVDRHPGSTLAVRLILKEDIGGQISLQRAAREAAAAREGLETGQEIVAARRALAAVEPALARARALTDPRDRLNELGRLRPQLADIATRFRRALQAQASIATLDGEIRRLAEEIETAAARRALEELAPRLATARDHAEPQARLAELQRVRPEMAEIARRYERVPQAVSSLRALDADIEKLRAEIAVVAAQAPFTSMNQAAGVGRVLRDCPKCPEIVVLPAGQARLASGRDVTITAPFAVGKFEVTFEEWDACVAQGACSHRPADRGWGRGRQPVMNVNWDDAQAYVAWLSRMTGKAYRLLSEAEWEYAAQAGSGRVAAVTRGANQANCDGCGSRWDDKQTAPVGSFAANAFGLHDMLGNVWEWTADCWNESHAGAAADGSMRLSGDCSRRVLRGGSWNYDPVITRSAYRNWYASVNRLVNLGFRVARTL